MNSLHYLSSLSIINIENQFDKNRHGEEKGDWSHAYIETEPAGGIHWDHVPDHRSHRLDHIGHHYADKLSVSEASAFVHMSQSQFMRAFKKVSGTTLVAYVNHVRLAAAAQEIPRAS